MSKHRCLRDPVQTVGSETISSFVATSDSQIGINLSLMLDCTEYAQYFKNMKQKPHTRCHVVKSSSNVWRREQLSESGGVELDPKSLFCLVYGVKSPIQSRRRQVVHALPCF